MSVSLQSTFWGIVTFVVVGIAAVILGSRSDILRDSEPVTFGGAAPPGGGQYRRPYSLAQVQMTWWFCIIIASFVFLWLARHQVTSLLTEGSLVLLGIGTGTALGATAIEQVKAANPSKANPTTLEKFNDTLAQIAALPRGAPSPALTRQRDDLAKALASDNFLTDILTDVDGVSLHRFQAAAWTAVLGVIFVVEVVTHLAMPDFDALTLAILGISGGTYLGFKIPERPN